VYKLKTIVRAVIGLYRGGGVPFAGFPGFEPRVATSKFGLAAKVRHLVEAIMPEGGEDGPCPNFACYALAFTLQLGKKHGKTSVRVTERCLLGTIYYVDMATLYR
jgi:hypothetical protein